MVLRLRGRGELGSSAIRLLRGYGEELRDGGGCLLLTGVGDHMIGQLRRTGLVDLLGEDAIFPAHHVVYRSTEEAFAEGRRRLASSKPAPA
jgi:hypothetical protein